MIKLKNDDKEVLANLQEPRLASRNESNVSHASRMNKSVIADIIKDR